MQSIGTTYFDKLASGYDPRCSVFPLSHKLIEVQIAGMDYSYRKDETSIPLYDDYPAGAIYVPPPPEEQHTVQYVAGLPPSSFNKHRHNPRVCSPEDCTRFMRRWKKKHKTE